MCKNENDEKQTRLAIGNGLLELMIFEIERYYTEINQPYLEVLWRTLFLLAYYGLLRIGELTSGSHPVKAKGCTSCKQQR